MKVLAYLVMLTPLGTFAGIDMLSRRVLAEGAEAKYLYRVVDDDGQPVPDADVRVSFSSYGLRSGNATWSLVTDREGRFTAAHRLNERFSVLIKKPGYYQTTDSIFYLGIPGPLPVKDGRWQPYGEDRVAILKKVRNPCAMRWTNASRSLKVPLFGEWVAFDLEEFAFCPPYGMGTHQDVLLRFTQRRSPARDHHMTMEVSFTNNPFSGVYSAPRDSFSAMASTYMADTNGPYQAQITYSYDRKSGQLPARDELGDSQYLVFRTRTAVDDEGRLVSAHYGKIYGPWEFVGPKGMCVNYLCFNPQVNDPNLEDARTLQLMERDSRGFDRK